MKKCRYIGLIIIAAFSLADNQSKERIENLLSKGKYYYNSGDYSNAIIFYEDLLAEQEISYGSDDFRIAETLSRLGEMYSIAGVHDISDYYFLQAIDIFEKSFQTRKDALEMPLINLLNIYSFRNDQFCYFSLYRSICNTGKIIK